jgi:hypothetical protein
MPGLKKRSLVPAEVFLYLSQMSKAALLDLVFDLAAPMVESSDDTKQVLDIIRERAELVCGRRGDRIPSVK